MSSAARSAHSIERPWPIVPVAPTIATVQSAKARPCSAQALSTAPIAAHAVKLLPLVTLTPSGDRSASPPPTMIELKPPSPITLAPRSAANPPRLERHRRFITRESKELCRQMWERDYLAFGKTAVDRANAKLADGKWFDEVGHA